MGIERSQLPRHKEEAIAFTSPNRSWTIVNKRTIPTPQVSVSDSVIMEEKSGTIAEFMEVFSTKRA
jgi:hypothetical protein